MGRLRGERKRSGARKRERESREHHKIGVEPNTLQSAHAERRERVMVVEASEFPLYRDAVGVERAEGVAVGGDAEVACLLRLRLRYVFCSERSLQRDDRG